MMDYLITNAKIVNEGKVFEGDVLIKGDRIERVDKNLQGISAKHVIDAAGKILMPGVIDDQVHFREPGLTHKGTIYSESRAALAGGITSFMEMPNTSPPVFTQELLDDKYQIAAKNSFSNYSFYMGTSNDNLDEVLKTDLSKVCGLKIFMGSSTGNLLVDNEKTLESVFSRFSGLIATHCEDERTITANTEFYKEKYGLDAPLSIHTLVRSVEACFKSSSFAVSLAKRHGTRLHILHISTAQEIGLFDSVTPLAQKKITAEACIHHLWFTDADYERLGKKIKWNPAIKTQQDQNAIWDGLLNNAIDVIATDHAPHTVEEKNKPYFSAASGGPLVQHSLVAMLEKCRAGKISLPRVVEKMCHNPSILFRIKERGFIREGYFADLVLVDPEKKWTVSTSNILAKCGWSPFEETTFGHSVETTFLNGKPAFSHGEFLTPSGKRLEFDIK
ncbi:MAG: dihydroorotase [Proteobacteria bacterium]|nr:dihydroorotase [Pseudomonadota bacterium]